MTPLEYFRLVAPEFADVDDAVINQWITIATNLTNLGCLNAETANMAIALYAAHLLSLSTSSNSSGGVGGLKREKEGDLEREYFDGGSAAGQSPYWSQYESITLGCYGSAIMTRGISCGYY